MSAKSKTGLFETPGKVSPATPKVASKVTRDWLNPLQTTRHLIERSPRSSLNSKLTIDRRSPKVATPPEAQLNSVQEDLKKAKEQISLIEKEKAQAIDELKEAQKAAEEATERLRVALVAQKRAEESSEIEKFRAVELEHPGIEAAQKKDEEWKNEIESVRNQHAIDVAALLSTTQELQRVKQELAELVRLKSLIDSKREIEANENTEMVFKLKAEIESLKQELEKAKMYEEKLMEKEALFEQLNVDLEAARRRR